MQALDSTRDLLLPVLRILSERRGGLDLRLDLAKRGDDLLCTAHSMTGKHSLSFTITKDAIKDGTYLAQFRTRVESLIVSLYS